MKNKTSREKVLAKMLAIIRKRPAIRPSQLNRALNLEHSANLRNTLIKQGFVRKERKGKAVFYYPL